MLAPPTFTVIVPTRDRAGLVEAAVRSVLSQEFSDFELIVVDAGSNDGGCLPLSSVEDRRVRVVGGIGPAGPSRARNEGISRARGDWVTFLDDDDEALPGWLSAFAHSTQADVGLLTSGYLSWDPDLSPGSEQTLLPQCQGALFSDVRAVFLAGTFAVRREVLERAGGYDERLHYSENTDLCLRLLRHCQARGLAIATIDAPLIRIRRRPRGRSYTKQRARAALLFLVKHAADFQSAPTERQSYLRVATRELYKSRDFGAAARTLFALLRNEPTQVVAVARSLMRHRSLRRQSGKEFREDSPASAPERFGAGRSDIRKSAD